MTIGKTTLLLLVSAGLQAQSVTFQQTKLTTGCTPIATIQAQSLDASTLVAGDFNGDGKSDLAFLCSKQLSVMLGKGDGTFQPPVLTTIDADASLFRSIQIDSFTGDFNRDGKTDLLLFNHWFGFAGVFLASANGQFRAPNIIRVTETQANNLYISDLTGDGNLDVVLSGNGSDGRSFFFLAGTRDGSFGAPTRVTLSQADASPQSLVVGDFNKDGKPDIAFIKTGRGTLHVALNAGSGTFAAPVQVASMVGNVMPVVADLNGDGNLDLASNSFYTLLGNGDGTFKPVFISSGAGGRFAFGDLNGDGILDSVQAGRMTDTRIALSFLKADGSFQFLEVVNLSVGIWPESVALADFNGDGKLDIVVSHSTGASGGTVLINTTTISGVRSMLNAASYGLNQPLAAGALAALFGDGLAPALVQADSIPLPTSLGKVSVTLGGIPAPLLFVAANQINLQVPWNIPSGSTVDVVVTVNGTALPAFRAPVAAFSPGIFTTQFGAGQAIAINVDGSLTAPEGSIPGVACHPAKPGDTIVILGTGLGSVTPAIANGAASLDGLRTNTTTPRVLIGGLPAQVAFSGLSPSFVGVNQLNVIVPETPAGVVALQIEAGGVVTTDKATIAIGR